MRRKHTAASRRTCWLASISSRAFRASSFSSATMSGTGSTTAKDALLQDSSPSSQEGEQFDVELAARGTGLDVTIKPVLDEQRQERADRGASNRGKDRHHDRDCCSAALSPSRGAPT
jgi:hypothetical protein